MRPKWRKVAVAGGIAVAAVLFMAGPPAAEAHTGGKAQLYVDKINVMPANPGWMMHVALVDADSARPQPGFAVTVRGQSPSGATFGPVTLTDAANTGEYAGTTDAAPGRWAITVETNELVGGPEGLPLTKTFNLNLAAVPGRPSGSAGGHSHSLPMLLAITVLPAAVIVCLPLRRRVQ
jgi:hypothetical protein